MGRFKCQFFVQKAFFRPYDAFVSWSFRAQLASSSAMDQLVRILGPQLSDPGSSPGGGILRNLRTPCQAEARLSLSLSLFRPRPGLSSQGWHAPGQACCPLRAPAQDCCPPGAREKPRNTSKDEAKLALARKSSTHEEVAAKADSTLRTSQAVPHPSTNRALRRLTSEVGRDPVHSTRYGRQRRLLNSG